MALAVALVSAHIFLMLDKFGEQLDFYGFFSFFFFFFANYIVLPRDGDTQCFTQTESSFW